MEFKTVALQWVDAKVLHVSINEDSVVSRLEILDVSNNFQPYTSTSSFSISMSKEEFDLNPLEVGDLVRIRTLFEKAI